MSGWYNGYSPEEREAKYRELKREWAAGSGPHYSGPCMLCGDPEVPTEPHSEDYSREYRWEPPAMFWLCRYCHRTQLHKRFADEHRWKAYLAHVKRGGFGRDLKQRSIRQEFNALRGAIARGEATPSSLPQLRVRALTPEFAYLQAITSNAASLTSPAARPRP